MNIRNTGHNITRHIRRIACIGALGTTFVVALPQLGHAQRVTPPPVPGTLNPPEGNEAFVPYEADYVFYKSSTATTGVAERN